MNPIILTLGFSILVSLIVIIIILIKRGPRESSTGAVNQLGPYRNLVLLSDKGGMARVYKAYNSISDRVCVLKVLRSDQLGDKDAVKKFNREAEILLKIKKTSPDAPVVSIYESGTISSAMVELPFIEMEYIPGNMDLSDYLKQRGRMQPEVAEKVVVQIIRALVASHDVGEVHRDLKPGNVLLYDGDPEKVVVCDFGVAKQVDSKSVTMGGYGTAAYMSPEQCLTGSRITPASDIYSLGVVFYELLTGKPVFSDDNPFVVMKRHQEEDPASLISKRFLEPFRSLLSVMLRKDPAKRPPLNFILSRLSSTALQILGYRSNEVEPVNMSGSVKGFPKRKLLVGALAGLLLVLSGALGLVYYNSEFSLISTGGTGIHLPPKEIEPAPKHFGALLLTSQPSGALVYIDGRLLGNTPLELKKIAVGEQKVLVKQDFFEDTTKTILIQKDKLAREDIILSHGKGDITILTSPSDVDIHLNGKMYSKKSPVTISGLRAGEYILTLHKDKYYDEKHTVTVMPNETEKVDTTLKGGDLVLYKGRWMKPEEKKHQIKLELQKKEDNKYNMLVANDKKLKNDEFHHWSKSRAFISKLKLFLSEYPKSRHVNQINGFIVFWKGDFKQRKKTQSITNSIGMTFVPIENGTFIMGSQVKEKNRFNNEDQHKVTISKYFYLQTTEVTQAQWTRVLGKDSNHINDCGSDCPVVNVTWNDAIKFIRKLNRIEKTNRYRLPTEAEWEYACRASTNTPYYFGNCIMSIQANFDASGTNSNCPTSSNRGRVIQVGSLKKNRWGLYDMHGNVWEWCNDWYGPYQKSNINNPKGPTSGRFRILRGGAWNSKDSSLRSAIRFKMRPDAGTNSTGFRIAMKY